MTRLLTQEPAMLIGVLVALLTLLIQFGVPITDGQQDALVAFAQAVLVVAGAVWIRSRVTPALNPESEKQGDYPPQGTV